MKTQFLGAISLFFGIFTLAQNLSDSQTKSQIFTINPSSTPKNTNGINVGVLDDYDNQKINGLNFQLNPISLIYLLIPRAIEVPANGQETVSVNGIHISTGGMLTGKKLNGVGISMYHIAQETNGITINGFNNNSGKLNGLHVSLINNTAVSGSGMLVSLSNSAVDFKGIQVGGSNENEKGKGLQIGILNRAKKFKGAQIGLVNKNTNGRSFQVGFWNRNSKRSLPFINF